MAQGPSEPLRGPDAPEASSAEAPRRLCWGLVLGTLLVFTGSCAVFWASTRVITMAPAWRTFEFCQYAEIGRNLAEDGTFDTRLVEPMALAAIERDAVGKPGARWPVVNRYPWPCLVIAALMRAAGPSETAAAWSNGLAISLLAALTYAVARCWYGRRWAFAVALLFLANPSFYGEFILLGTPDVWFAALFVAQLIVWSRLEPATAARPALGWALGLGVLSGLAYLSRFNATVFVAVQIVWLVFDRRWREALVIVATSALIAAPLVAYNWVNFHRPFVSIYSLWNLLDDIGAYRVEPWLYYRVPRLFAELAAHRSGLAHKFTTNLFTIVPARIWGLWRLNLLLPYVLLAPWALRTGQPGRFARWAMALFALQLVVFSALRLELEDRNSPHHGRYFFWFAAPVLLLSAGTLRRASTSFPGARWFAVAVVLIQLGQFGWAWSKIVDWHKEGTNLGRDPIRKMLAEVVTGGRVIASNQPQLTAWYGSLRSMSLPADPAELARLNRQSPTPADYLLIDDNFNCIDLDPRWWLLAQNGPRAVSPWEPELLRDYEYVWPPKLTRPLSYVVLRRRVVPPSDLERRLRAGQDSG